MRRSPLPQAVRRSSPFSRQLRRFRIGLPCPASCRSVREPLVLASGIPVSRIPALRRSHAALRTHAPYGLSELNPQPRLGPRVRSPRRPPFSPLPAPSVPRVLPRVVRSRPQTAQDSQYPADPLSCAIGTHPRSDFPAGTPGRLSLAVHCFPGSLPQLLAVFLPRSTSQTLSRLRRRDIVLHTCTSRIPGNAALLAGRAPPYNLNSPLRNFVCATPRLVPAWAGAGISCVLLVLTGSSRFLLSDSSSTFLDHARRIFLVRHSLLVLLQRAFLRLPIHPVSLNQHIEIHFLCVELWPVHACKLTLSSYQHAASAAHSRPVNHDRVQAHNGVNLLFTRQIGDCLHHRNRAHCQHEADRLSRLEQLPQFVRDQPLLSITSVICRHVQLVADRSHLLFQNHQVPVAPAHNRQHTISRSFQRGCRRVDERCSDSSSHDHHRPKILNY